MCGVDRIIQHPGDKGALQTLRIRTPACRDRTSKKTTFDRINEGHFLGNNDQISESDPQTTEGLHSLQEVRHRICFNAIRAMD